MEPTIYPFFKGKCLEAMSHYAEVLGGEIGPVFRNGDAPDPDSRVPGGDDLVINMSMILRHATIMASDNSESIYEKPLGFRVSIAPSSQAVFDRIYDALSRDTQSIEMAPEAPSGPSVSACSPTDTGRPGC